MEAIRAGRCAVIPTDTVYGLVASPAEASVRGLYRLKGRDSGQPTALLASSVEELFECIPELRGRAESIAGVLLPGPYTLILANPAHRYPWLSGTRPDAIGVRVPKLTGRGREVLDRVGVLAATSANLPGGPDALRLADVPAELLVDAVGVDGGELPGTPSTVIDFTGPEPVVLREGAAPSAEALRRVADALD